MATGDALQVGMAIPFVNWRADRDYNADGTPDGWGLSGSAVATWRKIQGSTTDHIRQYGLSQIGALGLYSATSSDYLYCRTLPNSVPQSGDTINAWLYSYVSPWHTTTDRVRVAIHILNAAGTSEGNTTNDSPASPERGKWQSLARVTPTFLSTTSSIEARWYDSGNSANPTRMMIDAPLLVWDARGLAGGPRAMDSPPSPNGTSLVPGTLAEWSRDEDGGIYLADPHAATPKWRLTLAWDYMSDDDYHYWLDCYAVNRGASGFKSASGRRLEPQPVVVMHHFWEPANYSASVGSHYLNIGKPWAVIGNIMSFDLSVRQYVGWGYSGSIVIEEA